MSLSWPFVLALLCLLAAGIHYRTPMLAWARLIRAPRTSIANLRPYQQARIDGCVRLREAALESPLMGGRCACYSLEIVDVASETGALLKETDGVAFELIDESGTIRIEPHSLHHLAARKTTMRVPPGNPALDNLRRHLERSADRGRHQTVLALLRDGQPLLIREAVIREGTTVSLHGQVWPRLDPSGASRLIFTCPDNAPLVIREARIPPLPSALQRGLVRKRGRVRSKPTHSDDL